MKPLPRAKPGTPGTIKPDSWNRVVDEIAALHKRISALTPHKSPDIIHKSSQNGFTSHLTRRGGRGVRFFHPWESSAAGGAIVSVGAGMIMGFRPVGTTGELFLPMVAFYLEYAGGEITVTANGFLYVSFEVIDQKEGETGPIPEIGTDEIHSYIYKPTGSLTVYFNEEAPSARAPSGLHVHLPIAQVSLADGVATVTKQILTHNPLIQLDGNLVYWG